jgi:folylpolyglutamate synthase/dihydropteroate synthase
LDRACLPERLAAEVKNYCSVVTVTESVAEALTLARKRARAEDLIFLTGSLYCVGEAFDVLDLPVL